MRRSDVKSISIWFSNANLCDAQLLNYEFNRKWAHMLCASNWRELSKSVAWLWNWRTNNFGSTVWHTSMAIHWQIVLVTATMSAAAALTLAVQLIYANRQTRDFEFSEQIFVIWILCHWFSPICAASAFSLKKCLICRSNKTEFAMLSTLKRYIALDCSWIVNGISSICSLCTLHL